MNLPEQTLRNLTTDELLSFSETLETIDRLTFSYISERFEKSLQDSQDELEEQQGEINELSDQLKDAKEALEKVYKIASKMAEEDDLNYQQMLQALMRVDDIAFDAKEAIIEGLFL